MADWKKTLGWTATMIGALLLLVIAAAVFLLKSSGFHRYLLAKIVQQTSQATGARVEIQTFTFHVKTLSADVYGVTVHGTEGASEKALLQVPHIRLGVRIISIFHHKVNLSELLVESPVANLVVNKEGRSNLPEPPKRQNQSTTNVFDLAVGHVLLTNGEIDLKDRKIPVNANLLDLRTEISFSQLAQKYSGTLSYRSGSLHYQQLRPLPHNLDARFEATPSELNLKPLVLRVGGSRLWLSATLRGYNDSPVASGRYDVVLHTQDFWGLTSANAAGDVALSGNLNYRDVRNQPLLRNVALTGELSSNGLALSSPQAALKIQKIAGRFQLAAGNLKADGLALDLLGGRLTADGTVEHVESTRQSRIHLALASISLQALKASVRNWSSQSVPVTGAINGTAEASWVGNIQNLMARSDITVLGSVGASNFSDPQSQAFPLKSSLHVSYDARRNLIRVPASSVQLPATSINAHGEIGDHSNLIVNASSTDLHQLILLARSLPSSAGKSSSASPSSVQGAATLNAVVQGALNNPKIDAQIAASNLQVNQSRWNSLQFGLTATASGVSIQNGTLVSARRGQLNFNGSIGLRHWAYAPSNPISASVQLRQMSLPELEQIANLEYPIEGDLIAEIRVRGSQLDPQGQGNIQITKARVSGEPLKDIAAQFQASGGAVHSTIVLGTAKLMDLTYTPKSKAYDARLYSSQIDLAKLHVVQAKNVPLKGVVTISANGAGTVDDPKLTALVQIDRLQLRDTTFTQVKADLNVADHLAKLALSSAVGQATLRGNATVHLTAGYYAEAALDTSKFPIDPILAVYVPSRPSGLHGETELHVALRGPLAEKKKLEAHLTLPSFQANYQSLDLASTAPIRIDYANSVVVLQPSSIKGTGTSLQFQGRVPVGDSAPMSVSAHGSIDLRLIQMISPDLRTGGTVAVDVNAGGTAQNPGVSGEIKLQNASFATESTPLGIENLNATMQLTNTGVQITNGVGQLGGGEITVGGSVLYRPQLEMDLAVSTKSVRLRYPDGMRTMFDSDLMLTGNQQASLLQGRVLVDALSFTEDFDMASFMGQFTGATSPPTGQSFADHLKLQITVQSTSQLSAGTSQLSIEGQANLRIIGIASDPVIVGRADLTSGDIFFMKRQYRLERGVLTFANPNQTSPVLNVLITTTINQYNLSLSIRGPIEKLQTSYISDPPLPPVDIINLIARGQTTQEGAPTSLGASTVLAAGLGQVESAIGSGASKLTGVAGLQIDPLLGGSNTNPSARIGFQKQVTKNFTFSFSTDVTQPQNEVVQGEYQLNKRWSVSLVRNESGGFAVDGKLHTNF